MSTGRRSKGRREWGWVVGQGADFCLLLCSYLQAKKPNGGKGGRPVWTPPSEMMSKCSLASLAACTGQGQSTDQRLWLMDGGCYGGADRESGRERQQSVAAARAQAADAGHDQQAVAALPDRLLQGQWGGTHPPFFLMTRSTKEEAGVMTYYRWAAVGAGGRGEACGVGRGQGHAHAAERDRAAVLVRHHGSRAAQPAGPGTGESTCPWSALWESLLSRVAYGKAGEGVRC